MGKAWCKGLQYSSFKISNPQKNVLKDHCLNFITTVLVSVEYSIIICLQFSIVVAVSGWSNCVPCVSVLLEKKAADGKTSSEGIWDCIYSIRKPILYPSKKSDFGFIFGYFIRIHSGFLFLDLCNDQCSSCCGKKLQ